MLAKGDAHPCHKGTGLGFPRVPWARPTGEHHLWLDPSRPNQTSPVGSSCPLHTNRSGLEFLWMPAVFSRISSPKGTSHTGNAPATLRFLRDLLFKKQKGLEQKQAKRAKATPPSFPSAPSASSCSKNSADWNGGPEAQSIRSSAQTERCSTRVQTEMCPKSRARPTGEHHRWLNSSHEQLNLRSLLTKTAFKLRFGVPGSRGASFS